MVLDKCTMSCNILQHNTRSFHHSKNTLYFTHSTLLPFPKLTLLSFCSFAFPRKLLWFWHHSLWGIFRWVSSLSNIHLRFIWVFMLLIKSLLIIEYYYIYLSTYLLKIFLFLPGLGNYEYRYYEYSQEVWCECNIMRTWGFKSVYWIHRNVITLSNSKTYV
jgi:hypothetical protein